MRKTSEISKRKDRSLVWLARQPVMCLESNWKCHPRAKPFLPISPSGESTSAKTKDTDKYKCLYMAIFNTKNLGMKAEYLAGGGDRIRFNGFI